MTPLPAYIEREAWEEYEAMRKRIKKPMTPRVIRQKLARLQEFKDKGHDVNAVIDEATNGHWLDFYEPKEKPISTKAEIQTGQWIAKQDEYKALSQTPEAKEAKRRAMERAGIRRVA